MNISRPKRQSVILLVVITFVLLVGILFIRRPKNLDTVSLGEIVAIPRAFKQQAESSPCHWILPNLIANAESTDLLTLGVLPKQNQIKQETVYDGCIRADIAVYSDERTASEAFYTLQKANENGATQIIYNNLDEKIILLKTPWQFEAPVPWSPHEERFAWNLDNQIGIIEKCRTVVTLFVFVQDESKGPDQTFGLLINESDIISYAKEVHQRIENIVCPIVAVLDD